MVEFSCLIRGKANYTEKINKEILKKIDAQEKFQIALKIMANSNNIETVTYMKIEDLNCL
jgi:dephospho-CoA kinase